MIDHGSGARTTSDGYGSTDVTLLTARTVEPGYEQEFQVWARRVTKAASRIPGYLGDGLFRPPADAGAWVLIHRFRDLASAQEWKASSEREALFDDCEGHHQTEVARREVAGMETLLTSPSDAATVAPPRWKMAVSAFAGALLISLIANVLLGPVLSTLPVLVRVTSLALFFSVLMTYLMMPAVTSVLRRWLYPSTKNP
jgi:antibiotic biosynthesis monooxygenase (ABM) superfamily enzyme